MFYHDHAYGLTRLNVYAGEAAGYLLYDPAEEQTLLNATVPGTIATNAGQAAPDLAHLIPLVIQDKTFVPSANQLTFQDPTWAGNFGKSPLNTTDPTATATSGSPTSTCRTRTRMTPSMAPVESDAGITAPGSSRRRPL